MGGMFKDPRIPFYTPLPPSPVPPPAGLGQTRPDEVHGQTGQPAPHTPEHLPPDMHKWEYAGAGADADD